MSRDVNKSIGIFGYSQISKDWSEIYVGPTWSPNSNIQLALGYGIESGESSGRVGGYLWAGKGKLSGIYLFEDGGSGPWHKSRIDYRLNPRFCVGLVEKSSYGLGLSTGYKLGGGVEARGEIYNDLIDLGLATSF